MFVLKRFKTLILMSCLALVSQAFGAVNCPETATSWRDCYSTPGDTMVDGESYKKITNEKELAWLIRNRDYNAFLTKNLDMSGKFWVPIAAGDGKTKYKKIFNGGGHVISNLFIHADSLIAIDSTFAQNLGFIACLTGEVRNLILKDIEVYGYGSGFLKDKVNTEEKPLSIGTVVGWLSMEKGSTKASVIDGCYVTGNIYTSGDGQAVGGIVGNIGGGKVSNCVSLASIDANGKAYVGGIAGYTKSYEGGKDTIASCVYAGNSLSSTGSGKVGGVVGYQYKGDVAVSEVYYDSDLNIVGVGKVNGGTVNGSSNTTLESVITSVQELNTETVVCILNGSDENGQCNIEPWSVGETGISLNGYGSDGYKIFFDAHGGFFENDQNVFLKYVDAGKSINDDGVPNLKQRSGYEFTGWSRDNHATSADEEIGSAAGMDTIYAVWNPIYTITFDANGGKFTPTGVENIKTIDIASGKAISIDGLDLPSYYDFEDGRYYFSGWNTVKKDRIENENYELTDEDTLHLADMVSSEGLTFYAVWSKAKTFSVTFDANGLGASFVSFVRVVYENETIVRPQETIVPATGYEFDDWYVDSEGSAKFIFGNLITENKVIYAKWNKLEYSINYHNCGGSCGNNPETYTVTDGFALKNPSWDGAHKFLGWSIDASFNDKRTELSVGTTGNIDYYAEWEEIEYKIAYRAGAYGNGIASPGYKKHGQPYTIQGSTFTRNGYEQDGWSLEDGKNLVYHFGDVITQNDSLILYPHWAKVDSYGAVKIVHHTGNTEAVINGTYGGADEPNLDEADAVEISSDITVNSVTLSRTFNAGKIATLYVPFEIDAGNVVGTEVYKFKTVVKGEDGRWKFKVATATKVMPNTPYVIIPEGTQVTFDIPTSVTLNTTTEGESTAANSWKFVGAYQYEKFTLDNNNPIYLFADQARDGAKLGEFVKIADGAFINPMRAYLVYHKNVNVAAKSASGNLGSNILLPDELDIEIENENGIVVQTGTLNRVTGEVRMDRWFDLKGRKLNSKPTVKGTYYKNGKRVVIK